MARPEGIEPPTLCLEGGFESILKSMKISGFHRLCFESSAAVRGSERNSLEPVCFCSYKIVYSPSEDVPEDEDDVPGEYLDKDR